jgi:hypothetical protein
VRVGKLNALKFDATHNFSGHNAVNRKTVNNATAVYHVKERANFGLHAEK